MLLKQKHDLTDQLLRCVRPNVGSFRRRRMKIRSRSNYFLRQVAAGEASDKMDAESRADRAPMLLRRDSSVTDSIRRDYINTPHMRGRPLPVPRMCDSAAEQEVILTTDICRSPQQNEAATMKRFSTFRPPRGDGGSGMGFGEGPYYFQLDPNVARRDQRHRPDVIQGYAICHPQPIDGPDRLDI